MRSSSCISCADVTRGTPLLPTRLQRCTVVEELNGDAGANTRPKVSKKCNAVIQRRDSAELVSNLRDGGGAAVVLA